MTQHIFIHPTDTLSPRGHLLFGAAGSFGAAAMPPAPSVFAGAWRSAVLGSDATRLAAFERREQATADLDFRLTHVSLARRLNGGKEALFPLPADLVALDDGLHRLEPQAPPAGIRLAHPLPLTAVLRAPQGKPKAGQWLTDAGFRDYLHDKLPAADRLVAASELWQRDLRPGLALDGTTRTGEDGALFSVEHIALAPGVGFIVGATGADAALRPGGALRLAGDGRSAQWEPIDWTPPAAPLEAITARRRFRLVLATPGLFADGWLPPGVDPVTHRLASADFSTQLVCAAVPRAELVSGWDLLKNQPKPALRAAPAGSVYWFDDFAGDVGKLAEWIDGGLWAENDTIDTTRRQEGWNRVWLGAWI